MTTLTALDNIGSLSTNALRSFNVLLYSTASSVVLSTNFSKLSGSCTRACNSGLDISCKTIFILATLASDIVIPDSINFFSIVPKLSRKVVFNSSKIISKRRLFIENPLLMLNINK